MRDFNAISGKELKEQSLNQFQALPDMIIACVGGGSNAMGVFHPFIEDETVELIGVEAGGKDVVISVEPQLQMDQQVYYMEQRPKYYSQTQVIFSKQIQFQLV